ncbi:MAG TPA: BON domain-containing protein [Usitatibacteraceae bacterium]|nr:BON domain-containing protein [Usitatibacteraceae bacterium]
MRRLLPFLALAIAAPLLSGCFGLAAGGIGAAALLVDDRRTTGIYVEDENIEWKALAKITGDFKGSHVNSTSFNRKVLLTGEAPTEETRKAVEEAVKSIPSVREVTNEIVVAGNSSITSRGNDSIITSNVKARMVGNGKFSPNHVKVVTEAGAVFLMGILTQGEGDAAVEIARSTSGVSRVVKAFEYVPETPKRN